MWIFAFTENSATLYLTSWIFPKSKLMKSYTLPVLNFYLPPKNEHMVPFNLLGNVISFTKLLSTCKSIKTHSHDIITPRKYQNRNNHSWHIFGFLVSWPITVSFSTSTAWWKIPHNKSVHDANWYIMDNARKCYWKYILNHPVYNFQTENWNILHVNTGYPLSANQVSNLNSVTRRYKTCLPTLQPSNLNIK